MSEISIIVPVYKVERYLDRCINSILSQTFTDLEVILVDDGSPDGSPQKCDEWAQKDHRILVIHKENGGLSSARNAGLEIAKGNYIGFVDSDDWISSDMYEILYGAIINTDADFASAKMIITKSEEIQVVQRPYHQAVLKKEELFRSFFRVDHNEIRYCVCDKLYKREILRDIRFWEGMRFEDIDFNFNVIQNCRKGVYLNQEKYFWFFNENSITRNSLIPNDLQLLSVWKKITKKCKAEYPQYYYYAKMNYERAYLGLLGKSVRFGISEKYRGWERDRERLVKHLRKYFIDLLQWKMPFSRKILLCALCLSPGLTEKAFQIGRSYENTICYANAHFIWRHRIYWY